VDNNGYFHENIRMQVAMSWGQLAIGLAKRHCLITFAQTNNQTVESINLKEFEKAEKYVFHSVED